MRAFRFPLEPLLRAKTVQEKLQKNELAKWMRRAEELEEQLTMLRRRMAEGKAVAEDALAKGVDPADLAAWEGYFASLRDEIKATIEAIEETERQIEAVRQVLTETLKEKKVLEKYKEKLYQAYLLKIRRMDEKALDEYMSTYALMV